MTASRNPCFFCSRPASFVGLAIAAPNTEIEALCQADYLRRHQREASAVMVQYGLCDSCILQPDFAKRVEAEVIATLKKDAVLQ